MNWDDIITLLEQGEGQSVEFEKYIPGADDIARDMVAFANSDGGKIIYGIDDKNKHYIGAEINDYDGFKNWVADIGRTRCKPLIAPQVEIIERSGKKVAVITIIEGDEKPYKTDDICYIRDSSESRPAREEEEKEISSPWSGKGLNKRQKRSLMLMTEHGAITNREYREAFNISHKTAHIELTMLAGKGLVLSQGSGRSTRYVLSPKRA